MASLQQLLAKPRAPKCVQPAAPSLACTQRCARRAPCQLAAVSRDAVTLEGRISRVIPLDRRDEELLASQGISSVRDLEHVHFDLHLSNSARSKQFLQDVIGIRNPSSIRNILEFLGAADDGASNGSGSMGSYEDLVIDTLAQYKGLSLDRLQNMLLLSTTTPRYDRSRDELLRFLESKVKEGSVTKDGTIYRYGNWSSPSRESAGSPTPKRAASPSRGSRARSPSPRPRMGAIDTYEPAVLELLQNYAGLSLERLDSLLTHSPKAAGYDSSPAMLSKLLARLMSEGKLYEENGKFKYSSHAAPTRSKSPTPSYAKRRLPPTPTGGRRKASPAISGRVEDVHVYEPIVLEFLQNYSSLTLERLDGLLAACPRAPGYSSNPAALAGLLTVLQSRGRITNENGVYRYKPTGKTPQAARRRSPAGRSSSPRPAANPMSSIAGLVDRAKRATGSSPAPPAASAPKPLSLEDWMPYDNTILTMVGNYGALPVERLHEQLKTAMVWPRFDRSTSQLSAYLDYLVSAGKLTADNGMYRLPGSGSAAHKPSLYPYSSTPRELAAAEGRVMDTLATFPGLSLERLNNILRLSKDDSYNLDEEQLASLVSSLVSQGKVTLSNGLYKVTSAAPRRTTTSPSPAPLPTSSSSSASNPLGLLDSLGFPTSEGLAGFTPFSEMWNGRWAMVGLLASVLVEMRTGEGTLEQLGFLGLPSMELFNTFVTIATISVVAAAIAQGARFASGNMRPSESDRYKRLLTRSPQQFDSQDRFYTPELAYARKAELNNGRAAMIGFLFGVAMEALTGRGVLAQVVLYLKLAGLIGVDA